jgi:2-isopropylmalate synthase
MGLEFEGNVYRWAESPLKGRNNITILDTSLRDGIQAPSIRYPKLEEKIRLLEFMDKIGIEYADIAMPIARGPHFREAVELARSKRELGLLIKLVCLARALPSDVEKVIELRDQSGVDLEVIIFKGSSPVRRQVEDWDVEHDLVKPMRAAVELAVANGLTVTAATEDTTRTEPEVMEQIFTESLRAGAKRLCIADTVGFSDPWSTPGSVMWVKEKIIGNDPAGLDWHGHNDLGQSVSNALIALGAGADRVHATILGIGERAGNTPTEQLIENLNQYGICEYDRRCVTSYAEAASVIFGRPISPDHPVVGSKVHSTSTGIHGAGIAKAEKKGRSDLAGIVYSPVNPTDYGRRPELGVGPLSGVWNAESNLRRLGIDPAKERVERVLQFAQMLYKELDDDEIRRASEKTIEGELLLWENNNPSTSK